MGELTRVDFRSRSKVTNVLPFREAKVLPFRATEKPGSSEKTPFEYAVERIIIAQRACTFGVVEIGGKLEPVSNTALDCLIELQNESFAALSDNEQALAWETAISQLDETVYDLPY